MKVFGLITAFFTLVPFLALPSANALQLQILHTNDLHASMLTHGTPRPGDAEYGGWAQIKTMMDRLTADAANHKNADGTPDPIETIRLDAGDYMEGTMDYFPDSGKDIIRAFQAMNYDAVTLGNHDWLMGARSLDAVFGEVPFSNYSAPAKVLSANLKISKQLPNLRAQVAPHIEIIKNGLKVSIFGLSTNEAFYSWITRIGSKRGDLKLQDYLDEDPTETPDDDDYDPGIATQQINQLREKDNLVIALTHIGYEADQKLAATTHGLDLIIGGHSHTILESWTQVNDLDGNSIPIVQTGVNGRYIGKIMVDYEPGKRPVVSTYELVEVPHETPQDPIVAPLVQKAEADLHTQYGPALDEVIGQTDVRLVPGDRTRTAFSKFAVDAMRESTHADVAIDIGQFHGVTPQPAGNVTRRNLMEMYPRKFEVAQNEGLYVYTTWVSGLVLRLAVEFGVKYGFYLPLSGMHADITRIPDAEYNKVLLKALKNGEVPSTTPYRASNFRIDNMIFCDHCIYRVAVPESFLRGIYSYSFLTKLILRDGVRTNVTIWNAMTDHLKEIKTIQSLAVIDQTQTPDYTLVGNAKQLPMGALKLNDDESTALPWVTGDFSIEKLADSLLHDTHSGADVSNANP